MAYGGNLHVNKPLTTVAVEYKNDSYIAMDALGTVKVQKESDLYYTFIRDFYVPDARRANGAVANQASWGVSTSSYTLNEWALWDIVTDRDRDNSDSIDMDVQTTQHVQDKVLLNFERDVMQLMFTTSTWGGNATLNDSSTSWNASTITSTPIANVLSATSYMVTNSGKKPNTGIIGYTVFDTLRLHTDITARIQYVERGIANKDVIASMFDLASDRLFIGSAVHDTGNPGDAESLGYIWGGHAWFGYIEKSPGIKKLSAAYVFAMKEQKVKKWRDEERSGDKIESSMMARAVAVATACAYFIKDAVI